jgi:hypothetical protein
MNRRRLGWARATAVGVPVSTGAPIGWSLARLARLVRAGVVESFADSTPIPASVTPEPASLSASSVPVRPEVLIPDGRPGTAPRGGPESVGLEPPSRGAFFRMRDLKRGDPVLTCGGGCRRDIASYKYDVVVTAVPEAVR